LARGNRCGKEFLFLFSKEIESGAWRLRPENSEAIHGQPAASGSSNPAKMKVTFVTDTYASQANGVATTMERLVKGLSFKAR